MADTPLHEAVRYSDLEEVSKALNEGYNPNELGAYQWTPLHEACNNGDTEIVKLLLQHNGDPDVKDSLRGCTSVHYAASQDNIECLKLLLAAGARCDVVNCDRQSALDVSVGDCQELLQAEYHSNIIYNCQEIELSKKKLIDGTSVSSANHSYHKSDDDLCLSDSGSKDVGDQDSLQDLDQISIGSGGSACSHPSWGSDGIVRLNSKQVLGNIQLSFEYNSKKSTLKIRVWKVMDLLMPPSDTSMIHSIYVKSYLQPDKQKQTKRKTEEIKIEQKSPRHGDKTLQSGSEIFKSSSFSFSKSLEYQNINSSLISSQELLLLVCITQKYTRRSFTIATWSMPLKSAIKRVLKEKYALKACISSAIPEHMKVYNATELQVIKSRTFGSNPSLICRSSSKWTETSQERSVSDSDLKRERSSRHGRESSIEITVQEKPDLELEDALQQILIMEKEQASIEGRPLSTTVDLTMRREEKRSTKSLSKSLIDDDSNDSSIEGVKVEPNTQLAEVEIHIPDTDLPAGVHHVTEMSHIKRPKGVVEPDLNETVVTEICRRKADVEISIQKPEVMTWDYYSETPEFSSVVIHNGQEDDLSSVRLPMAATLELPEVHGSFMSTSHDDQSVVVDVPRLSSLHDDNNGHRHHHHFTNTDNTPK
ncbi:hypothetical protein LSH36_302g03013 [Paralvinella palmiformis]|uniref:Uncharacterized protein n=1 Tax=Paralvinella palmiformis TaxID=53620 RepID=A0AAD9JIF1_9ANNE|nr:hypothetical protein LSH36_302g03013 [Paralvinella palmiformis]